MQKLIAVAVLMVLAGSANARPTDHELKVEIIERVIIPCLRIAFDNESERNKEIFLEEFFDPYDADKETVDYIFSESEFNDEFADVIQSLIDQFLISSYRYLERGEVSAAERREAYRREVRFCERDVANW